MDTTFFNFKLDLEPNVIDMIYDIIRMSTIQLGTQLLFYLQNSSISLFSETFIRTFAFINMSILFYYLVIRKLFSFISDDYLRVKDKKYTSTPPITSRTSNDLNKVTPTTPSMPTLSIPTPPPAVAIQPSIPPKLPDQPNNSTNTILTQSNNSVPKTTTNT